METRISSHGDGTKGDKGKGEEDEDAKHMWIRHEDDQEELGHVEELLERALHPSDNPSLLLLHLLLLDLGNYLLTGNTTLIKLQCHLVD